MAHNWTGFWSDTSQTWAELTLAETDNSITSCCRMKTFTMYCRCLYPSYQSTLLQWYQLLTWSRVYAQSSSCLPQKANWSGCRLWSCWGSFSVVAHTSEFSKVSCVTECCCMLWIYVGGSFITAWCKWYFGALMFACMANIYRTHKFITVLSKACHCTMSLLNPLSRLCLSFKFCVMQCPAKCCAF
jgi:hypothetical protein